MAAPIIQRASGPWTPPQWAKPAMVSITVPAGYAPPQATSASNPVGALSSGAPSATLTTYVFDAVLSLEHEQGLTKTHHPVQNSSSISTHAYIEPAQLTLYVLMSDVTGVFNGGVGQLVYPYIQPWTGNPSKSVSAYQTVLSLQIARVPLTITTRLRTYVNMIITKLSPHEDHKSITGARFRIDFEQIFVVNSQATPSSTRPNDTQSTGLGSTTTSQVPASVTTQFGVPPSSNINQLNTPAMSVAPLPTYVDVPGAGTFSSTPQQFGGVSAAP